MSTAAVQEKQSVLREMIPVLDSVISAKLEDKVLKLIDLSAKGMFDFRLEEYLGIAERQNLPGHAETLRQIAALAGFEYLRILREKAASGKRNSLVEAQLEQYLSSTDKLQRIEPGLEFLSRQFPLASGVVDIEARDRNGRTAFIELKARDDPSVNTFEQISKYLAASKEERILFVAPQIKPDVFFGIKGIDVGGRVSFFEVSGNNGEYDFKQVDESSFPQTRRTPKTQKIQKKRDENEPTGIIKIKKSQHKLHSIIEKAKETAKDESMPSWFYEWDGLLDEKGKYKGKVSDAQMKRLSQLVYPKNVKASLDMVISGLENQLPNEDFLDLAFSMPKETMTVLSLLLEPIGEFTPKLNLFIDAMSLQVVSSIDTLDKDYDKVIGKYSQLLKMAESAFKSYIREFHPYTKAKAVECLLTPLVQKNPNFSQYISDINFEVHGLLARNILDFLNLKKQRAEALYDIHPLYGVFYLAFPSTSADEGKLHLPASAIHDSQGRKHTKYIISPAEYLEMRQEDMILYLDLVSTLLRDNDLLFESDSRTVTEQAGTAGSPANRSQSNQPQFPGGEELQKGTFYESASRETLYHAIAKNGSGAAFTADMQKRIEYMVDDVFSIGLQEQQITALADNFRKLDIQGKFLLKGRPKEIELRNFLDDITLFMRKHHEAPRYKEMKESYKSSIHGHE